MLLSDKDIKTLALNKELISPFTEKNCEGATINLTLDVQVRKFSSNEKHIMGNEIDNDDYEEIDVSKSVFYLNPQESVLVQSYEYFSIPTDMSGIVFERYSIKLMGLVVSPASYMNPGYEGRLSFLVTNNSKGPIQLVAGIKFCQLGFVKLSSNAEVPYELQDGKYMGSKDVQISKLHLDVEIRSYLEESNSNSITSEKVSYMSSHLLKEINENAKKYSDIIKESIGEHNHDSPLT